MSTLVPVLSAAHDAFERGAHGDAIDLLVPAWRTVRDPELADVVDRISELDVTRRVEEERPRERHERWLREAVDAKPSAIGPLLGSLLDVTGSPQATERLRAAAAWPDDPRVPRRAMEVLETMPFKKSFGPEGSPFYAAAAALVRQVGDPRSAARVRALRRYLGPAPLNPEQFVSACMDDLLRDGADVDPPRPLSVEEVAALGKLRETVARVHSLREEHERRGADLLGAVFADPSDDAARAVYADWLSERGDPRGELIALQLDRHRRGGKPSVRERTLLSTHGDAWLGPLAGVVLKQGQRWERGFLAGCVFAPKSKDAYAAAEAHPSFATVEELEMRTWNRKGDALGFLSKPVFGSLRVLRGLREEALLEILAAGVVPHVRVLGFEVQRAHRRTKKAERALAELASFAALDAVELTPHPDAPEEAHALAATMKRVRVTLVGA